MLPHSPSTPSFRFVRKRTLLDAVNYLHCGLLNRDYGTDEVILERDGVIFNELAMLETNSDYALNAAIRLADTNKMPSTRGGFTQTRQKHSSASRLQTPVVSAGTITTLVYSNAAHFFEQCKEVVTAVSVKAQSEKQPSVKNLIEAALSEKQP